MGVKVFRGAYCPTAYGGRIRVGKAARSVLSEVEAHVGG